MHVDAYRRENIGRFITSRACPFLASALTALATPPVRGEELNLEGSSSSRSWELIVSPLAIHWKNEKEHSHVVSLGLERGDEEGTLMGVSAFRNSFGQPCLYAYYGYRWDGLFDNLGIFFKLTGGVLYGYKGQHKNNVPFNHSGFGLAVIPAVGYRLSASDAVQVGVLGTAGLVLSYSHRF